MGGKSDNIGDMITSTLPKNSFKLLDIFAIPRVAEKKVDARMARPSFAMEAVKGLISESLISKLSKHSASAALILSE